MEHIVTESQFIMEPELKEKLERRIGSFEKASWAILKQAIEDICLISYPRILHCWAIFSPLAQKDDRGQFIAGIQKRMDLA